MALFSFNVDLRPENSQKVDDFQLVDLDASDSGKEKEEKAVPNENDEARLERLRKISDKMRDLEAAERGDGLEETQTLTAIRSATGFRDSIRSFVRNLFS